MKEPHPAEGRTDVLLADNYILYTKSNQLGQGMCDMFRLKPQCCVQCRDRNVGIHMHFSSHTVKTLEMMHLIQSDSEIKGQFRTLEEMQMSHAVQI